MKPSTLPKLQYISRYQILGSAGTNAVLTASISIAIHNRRLITFQAK
jgi:hypothetical protein